MERNTASYYSNSLRSVFVTASYRSLITLAEAGSSPTAATLLEASLLKERAMAARIESLPDFTLKYVG